MADIREELRAADAARGTEGETNILLLKEKLKLKTKNKNWPRKKQNKI